MISQLKSVVLSLGVIDRHLSVEQAVLLSRLEEEYQVERWHNCSDNLLITVYMWGHVLHLVALFSPHFFLSSQIRCWGNVEWAHDYDMYELRARTAAGALFVHLTSESSTVKRKLMRD